MWKRDNVLREDFDKGERHKIFERLWAWTPVEIVAEAATRTTCSHFSEEEHARELEKFCARIADFDDEWSNLFSGYDLSFGELDEEGLCVLPVAFFLDVCRSGWDPNEEVLRFGYYLMQVDEGLGRDERPAQLGPKIRDPESELDYDAVGW